MWQTFDLRYNPKSVLSPSALNTYLDCSLKFYYKYVARLEAPDEVSSEIDAAKFGSIFMMPPNTFIKTLRNMGKT